jgi:hypothetical protein
MFIGMPLLTLMQLSKLRPPRQSRNRHVVVVIVALGPGRAICKDGSDHRRGMAGRTMVSVAVLAGLAGGARPMADPARCHRDLPWSVERPVGYRSDR